MNRSAGNRNALFHDLKLYRSLVQWRPSSLQEIQPDTSFTWQLSFEVYYSIHIPARRSILCHSITPATAHAFADSIYFAIMSISFSNYICNFIWFTTTCYVKCNRLLSVDHHDHYMHYVIHDHLYPPCMSNLKINWKLLTKVKKILTYRCYARKSLCICRWHYKTF